MKYIEKKAKNEPESLRIYRDSTPNATYNGFAGSIDLKYALIAEQGGICAYCMRRINLKLNANYKYHIEVEHIKPQAKYPEKSLDYSNIVGVCNGNLGGNEHCDKSKKANELKRLNPTFKNCEDIITYSISGLIKSNLGCSDVEDDINNVLNLNNQNLVDSRKVLIDLVIERLDKKFPRKTWTKKLLLTEIEISKKRDKNNNYFEFCNYVVWYLTELSNKPKYK